MRRRRSAERNMLEGAITVGGGSRGLMIDVRISQGSAWETPETVELDEYARILGSPHPPWLNDPRRRRDLNSKVIEPSSLESQILGRADRREVIG